MTTATTRPSALHRIEDGEAVCDGDETSACHFYPQCECEYWPDNDEHAREHPSVVHPECWITPWINAGDLEDSFEGKVWPELDDPTGDRPWPNGLIETTWEGEYVLWHYAPTPPTTESETP